MLTLIGYHNLMRKQADRTIDVSNNRVFILLFRISMVLRTFRWESARKLTSPSGGSFFAFFFPVYSNRPHDTMENIHCPVLLQYNQEILHVFYFFEGNILHTLVLLIVQKEISLSWTKKILSLQLPSQALSMHLVIGYYNCISNQHRPQISVNYVILSFEIWHTP
jgi:hypothetical protein